MGKGTPVGCTRGSLRPPGPRPAARRTTSLRPRTVDGAVVEEGEVVRVFGRHHVHTVVAAVPQDQVAPQQPLLLLRLLHRLQPEQRRGNVEREVACDSVSGQQGAAAAAPPTPPCSHSTEGRRAGSGRGPVQRHRQPGAGCIPETAAPPGTRPSSREVGRVGVKDRELKRVVARCCRCQRGRRRPRRRHARHAAAGSCRACRRRRRCCCLLVGCQEASAQEKLLAAKGGCRLRLCSTACGKHWCRSQAAAAERQRRVGQGGRKAGGTAASSPAARAVQRVAIDRSWGGLWGWRTQGWSVAALAVDQARPENDQRRLELVNVENIAQGATFGDLKEGTWRSAHQAALASAADLLIAPRRDHCMLTAAGPSQCAS